MDLQGNLSTTTLLSNSVTYDMNGTENCSKDLNGTLFSPMEPASTQTIIGLSILFCQIGLVGIVGNFLVICVIILDRKMRQSVTNIFIMNLAIADLLIMLFGIPEIIQFMLNRGWILGHVLCKLNRYILVVSLYTSVISLVSVCVER